MLVEIGEKKQLEGERGVIDGPLRRLMEGKSNARFSVVVGGEIRGDARNDKEDSLDLAAMYRLIDQVLTFCCRVLRNVS
ncbi:hypothetical protein FXO37_07551 [Capsicum annuum]|nr:hypothetical protein FXO37_07551 [Capsicum annuum]